MGIKSPIPASTWNVLIQDNQFGNFKSVTDKIAFFSSKEATRVLPKISDANSERLVRKVHQPPPNHGND